MEMFDEYGPYGSPSFILAPRCQIFLSTYAIKGEQLLKQNKEFLESYQLSGDDSKILVNEIVESRLISMKTTRNQDRPYSHTLTVTTEQSGKFYFYVLMQEKIVYSKEISISVSEKEK